MKKRTSTDVILSDGSMGTIEAWQPDQGSGAQALVRLDGGQRLWVPTAELVARSDGRYQLPLARDQIAAGPVVVPVINEELKVDRRVTDTGVVRLRKVVHERDEVVNQVVTRETVEVERVPLNRVVAAPPPPRQEGDTLVIPVLEEVLVVEKRLVLKEELRVTRRRVTEPAAPQTVTLRTEEIVVERDGAAGTAPRPDEH